MGKTIRVKTERLLPNSSQLFLSFFFLQVSSNFFSLLYPPMAVAVVAAAADAIIRKTWHALCVIP
jgi:hypothetical protein